MLQMFNCYAMEQENVSTDLNNQETIQQQNGIVLLSKTNNEYVINEEAVHNSKILLKHRPSQGNKISLVHSNNVVKFLSDVLNNPLDQELLTKKKVKSLKKMNDSKKIKAYISALEEFEIPTISAFHQLLHSLHHEDSRSFSDEDEFSDDSEDSKSFDDQNELEKSKNKDEIAIPIPANSSNVNSEIIDSRSFEVGRQSSFKYVGNDNDDEDHPEGCGESCACIYILTCWGLIIWGIAEAICHCTMD